MGTITSIRAPVPIAETSLPPLAEPRRAGIASAGAAAVAAPVLAQAVQQAPSKPLTSDPQLLTARTTAETSAAEAAEAARAAYIKASIAAGLSPLPLG
jgi:hypothetical protein